MKIKATTADAYQLVHDGILALARAERQGIRIDVEYCERKRRFLVRKMELLQKKLEDTEFYRQWHNIYGTKTNIHSNQQLARILYKVMKITPPKMTAKKAEGAADEEALGRIDIPELKIILDIRKLVKVKETYLGAFIREQNYGWLHPSFNLHTVRSFRSCVAKGTKILVARDFIEYPDGVPIENVHAGDYVYCFDNELQPVIGRVTWAGKTGHKEVIRIHYRVNKVGTGYLDATPEHEIRLISGKYVKARDLVGDLRGPQESKRLPRIRALSCRRSEDRLDFTGCSKNGKGILESHFIYSQLIGQIKSNEIIHHKNKIHLDHALENLEKTTLSEHSAHHVMDTLCSPQARINNRLAVQKAWQEGKYTIRKGVDSPQYLGLSKIQCLRLLAEVGGKVSKVTHDFNTFKAYLQQHKIVPWMVRLRYDKEGRHINRGRLKALSELGRAEVGKLLGMNHYKLLKLYKLYNLNTQRRWGNQFGPFMPGNHTILKIERINQKVDVYDIEVEKYHNFIANEICVHNSSSHPNFQNIPKRDKTSMEICRRALFPRPGHMLIEADFSALEVMISCCYHKDPVMLRYVRDKKSDMHLDMAKQLFLFDDLDKNIPAYKLLRQAAKNQFVFPQFYGDYYANNAKGLADWVKLPQSRWKPGMGIELPDGDYISDHLRQKGIKSFDKFVEHVQRVENDFWNNRFKVYNSWRKAWVEKYRKRGYLKMLTGFICSGALRKNEIINLPIQGTAFHCLLLTFIKLDEAMRSEGWDSRLIGQIHDSIVMDVRPDELSHIQNTLHRIVREELPATWRWINVPLEVEIEAYEVDKPWVKSQ